MVKLPEIINYRLISLMWVDAEKEPHKNIVCAVAGFAEERSFMAEFDRKGWLYNSIIETNGVEVDKVNHLRLFSETLPYVEM